MAAASAAHDAAAASPLDYPREDLVRVLMQTLRGLGYSESAAKLQAESGLSEESGVATSFREAVLAGNWTKVEDLLPSLPSFEVGDDKMLKFLIFEQKFLELLEQRDVAGAVRCLQTQLTPLHHDTDRVHQLGALVMCKSAAEVRERANGDKGAKPWPGSTHEARKTLLRKIEPLVSTTAMIPEDRLRHLLTQSLTLQLQNCLYHNSSRTVYSLLHDHRCGRQSVPTRVTGILRGHSDEVWQIAFSHDGKRLASASKDGTCIIWDVATQKSIHKLQYHSAAVNFVAWSPDDKFLLTCGSDGDHSLILWDARVGNRIHILRQHKQGISACAWSPDGKFFASGSTDKSLCVWNADSFELHHKWQDVRSSDMAFTPDGKKLVVVCYERKLRVYDFEDLDAECKFVQETHPITSLSLSSNDGRCALLSLASRELHLWDLESMTLVRKFLGHDQDKFTIRSCFGGHNDTFVASGSEDCNVYIWHQRTGELLEKLDAHTSSVNCAAWNPTDVGMLASASDDHTVRLWGPAEEEGSDGDQVTQ
eukprot:m.14535 g.14535  ORF g.14535 m.14535 type:complete len:536 (+) comp3375_c0_seq2:217-1824(+)